MSTAWYDDLVAEAQRVLPPHVFRFVTTGAREGVSAGEATAAWRGVRFLPRVLHDVGELELGTTLLGTPCSSPLAVAPTSMLRLVHPEGELGVVTAARDAGSLVVVSSNAGTSFEQVGAVGASWWLQAYLTADRDLVAPVLESAAAAGASAVVLTVDTPFPGTKYDIDDGAFGDLTQIYGVNHPEWVRGATPGSEHARDVHVADIGWIRRLTGLPVVVKGVLRATDARRCEAAGASAVWVSNHGGRQLDRVVTTAAALPAVVSAVGQETEVYVDGGVRSGLDALAALALGARGVFVGRAVAYGLAVAGADGTREVLDRLASELLEALALSGCGRLADARELAH